MTPQLIAIIGELLKLAIEARDKARQSEEWTTAQEEAWGTHIEEQMAASHWQPDLPIDPPPQPPTP